MDTRILTTESFNNKYKDYLEEGHYGLDISDPKVIFVLYDIFEDLVKIPNFKYQQIKLKFGTARFYATGISRELCTAIELNIEHIIWEGEEVKMKKEN